jgi:hypothetical protein
VSAAETKTHIDVRFDKTGPTAARARRVASYVARLTKFSNNAQHGTPCSGNSARRFSLLRSAARVRFRLAVIGLIPFLRREVIMADHRDRDTYRYVYNLIILFALLLVLVLLIGYCSGLPLETPPPA